MTASTETQGEENELDTEGVEPHISDVEQEDRYLDSYYESLTEMDFEG